MLLRLPWMAMLEIALLLAVALWLLRRNARVRAVLDGTRRRLTLLEAQDSTLAERCRLSEERYRLIADNCHDVICVCALPDLRFTYVSPSAERQCGWKADELQALPPGAVLSEEVENRVRTAVAERLERIAAGERDARFLRMELELPHRLGHRVPVELSATILLDERGPREFLCVSRDVTDRRTAEEAVRKLAFHDPLTGLPGRRLLEDRLAQGIARARRERRTLAVLFIDLDGFKQVNDELGHGTGDWLLCELAQRMCECVRASDTVARLGGDEFVVLLSDLPAPGDALIVAEKLRSAAKRPFLPPGGEAIGVSCSIGIATYPAHARDAAALLRKADEAMYRAKHDGKNAIRPWRDADPARRHPASLPSGAAREARVVAS